MFIESTPCISVDSPHDGSEVTSLVELSHGFFASCSDFTVKRWLISTDANNNKVKTVQHVNSCIGHNLTVRGAIEKDDTTLITGSHDAKLKQWDLTTKTATMYMTTLACQCAKSVKVISDVFCLIKTKCKTRFVCGLLDGSIQIRRISDLSVITTFRLHDNTVTCMCELDDGTFVTGSADNTMKRWNDQKETLQSFSKHPEVVMTVMKLNRDVIVSTSCNTVYIWAVSTGECLHTLTLHTELVFGLVKLSIDMFVTGSWDKTLRVWSDSGVCVETIESEHEIMAMARVGDVIVTSNANTMEIRKLK